MPPQPLSHFKPGIGFSLTGDGFEQRPTVAQGIALCIAQWAWVETQLGRLFISLVKGDQEKGAEAYAAYGSAGSKQLAIKAVAIATLPEQQANIIEALLLIIKSHEKIRNKIAHWFWGVSQIENAMILVDPKTLWRQTGRHSKAFYSGDHRKVGASARLNSDDVYVYTAEELAKDARDFGEIALLINKILSFTIRSPTGSSYSTQYTELTQDTRMAGALRGLQKG